MSAQSSKARVSLARAGTEVARPLLAGVVMAFAALPCAAGAASAQQPVLASGSAPGWLGIQYSLERRFLAGNPMAVSSDYRVTDVHPVGPAAAAGIRVGDVMLRIRGPAPGDTVFERIAETLRAGDTVVVTLQRGRARLSRSIVAANRPEQTRQGPPPPAAELAGLGRTLLLRETVERGSGMTIVFRTDGGQGTFSYRIVGPEPGVPLPFAALVVRTPTTDSLASLINMKQRDLTRVEEAALRTRMTMLAATSMEALDEGALRLASLYEQRTGLTAQLTALQDRLAYLSRERLGNMRSLVDEVSVRVSTGTPLTPLVRMERRYLVGAEIVPVEAELGEYFGVTRGILVAAAPEGTPAAAAGLAAGDVIVRVGDTEVATPLELSQVLRTVRGPIVLTVMRNRAEREVRLRR